MTPRSLLALRLAPGQRRFRLGRRLREELAARLGGGFLGAFRLHEAEERFVRRLARAKTNLWIFRSNQHAFCGDFVVVDMSSPAPEGRRVFVVDLKQGAALRLGGGGAGVQFRNAALAVCFLAARTGIVPADARFTLVAGDAEAVHGYLCAAC